MKGGPGPWVKWHTRDYIRDTRSLSPSSKGIWADLLMFMHDATNRGILKMSASEYCRLCGCTISEFERFLAEAANCNLCEISCDLSCDRNALSQENNGCITLSSRRMVREEKSRKNNAERQARARGKGREDAERNAGVTVQKLEAKKLEARLEQEYFLDGNTSASLENPATAAPLDSALKLLSETDPFSVGKWTDKKDRSWIAQTRTTFPDLDIDLEIRKAATWCLANPKRTPRKSQKRFLANWFSRADEFRRKEVPTKDASGAKRQDGAKPRVGDVYKKRGGSATCRVSFSGTHTNANNTYSAEMVSVIFDNGQGREYKRADFELEWERFQK